MISLGVLLSRRRPTLWDLQILCISMGWDSEEKMNWFVMLKMISSVFSPFPSGMPENLRHVHLEYCSIPSILFSKFVTVQRRWVIFDMRYSCMQFWIAELPRSISMHFVVPSLSLVSSSIRALSCNKLWLVIFPRDASESIPSRNHLRLGWLDEPTMFEAPTLLGPQPLTASE